MGCGILPDQWILNDNDWWIGSRISSSFREINELCHYGRNRDDPINPRTWLRKCRESVFPWQLFSTYFSQVWLVWLCWVYQWAYSSLISQDLSLSSITGSEKNFPLATIAVFISLLCLAGFPITAEFPAYLAIWQSLFLNFPLGGISALVGSLGILIGCVRTWQLWCERRKPWIRRQSRRAIKNSTGVGIIFDIH